MVKPIYTDYQKGGNPVLTWRIYRYISLYGMKRDRTRGLTAFRLPKWMSKLAKKKAKAEDLTFSQLMRHAIRRACK